MGRRNEKRRWKSRGGAREANAKVLRCNTDAPKTAEKNPKDTTLAMIED